MPGEQHGEPSAQVICSAAVSARLVHHNSMHAPNTIITITAGCIIPTQRTLPAFWISNQTSEHTACSSPPADVAVAGRQGLALRPLHLQVAQQQVVRALAVRKLPLRICQPLVCLSGSSLHGGGLLLESLARITDAPAAARWHVAWW